MMLLKISGKTGEKSTEFLGWTKSLPFVNSLLFKMFVYLQNTSLYRNQLKLFSSASELEQKINGWSLLTYK